MDKDTLYQMLTELEDYVVNNTDAMQIISDLRTGISDL